MTHVTYTLLTNQDQYPTMMKQRGFKASSDPWKQVVYPACMLGRVALAWVGEWGCFDCVVTPITQGWHRADHSKSVRCKCVWGHCEGMWGSGTTLLLELGPTGTLDHCRLAGEGASCHMGGCWRSVSPAWDTGYRGRVTCVRPPLNNEAS